MRTPSGGTVPLQDNSLGITWNIPVTGVDATAHTWQWNIDSNAAWKLTATGNGAGGVGNRSAVLTVADLTFTQDVVTSGSPTAFRINGGAHTTLTASTEASDVVFGLGRTVQFAAGSITTQRAVVFNPPTYAIAGGGGTITNAATVAITGSPGVGTGVTPDQFMSLWVQQGLSKFDDFIQVNTTATSGGTLTFSTSPGNHTAMTSELENHVFGANTITITGSYSTQMFTAFDQPTITAASALTIGLSANIIINGAPKPAGAGPATITTTAGLIVSGGVMASGGGATTITSASAIIIAAPIKGSNVTVTTSYGLLHQYATGITQPNVIVGEYLDFDTNYTTGASALTGLKISIDGTNLTSKSYIDFYKDTTQVFNMTIDGATTWTGQSVSGGATLLTVTGGAHTAVTAATENIGANFNFSATKTWAAGAGPLATQREIVFQAPTYNGNAGGALTITAAATVYITGAPVQGTNITLSNTYAFWVDAGNVRFDGNVAIGLTTPTTVLDVAGAVSATPVTNGVIRILTTGSNPATGNGGGLLFAQQDSGGSMVNYASITGTRVNSGANNKVNFVISTGAPTDGIAIASRVVIDTDGAVSLSTAALAVGATYSSGNGIFVQNASTNNAISTASQGAGTTTLYIGNGAITVVSDARLKENVIDTQHSALDLINQFRVVDYTWSPKWAGYNGYAHRGQFTGMIAQELVKLMPSIVNANGGENCERCLSAQDCADHGEWHVEYDHLVPTLVKAIQELNTEVAALKAR